MANDSKSVNSPYQVAQDITWDEEKPAEKKKFFSKWKIVSVLTLLGISFFIFYLSRKNPDSISDIESKIESKPILSKAKPQKKKFSVCEELKQIHKNSLTNVSGSFFQKCR